MPLENTWARPAPDPGRKGFRSQHNYPAGPELPSSVSFDSEDLKYPTATGVQPIRDAIRDYYNHFYDAGISSDNVAVFAGGRPGIFASLLFAQKDVRVLVEETEYTPYFDMLKLIDRDYSIIPSNPENRFRPTIDDYRDTRESFSSRTMLIRSNPCNPTGVTWNGKQLQQLVEFASETDHGGIFDEAYEFFNADGPVSALKYVKNIDETNIFVVGAATKGLQTPGMRTGWVIASKEHVEIFRNFSSIAMGGVSRPSQIYVTGLLELNRVKQARETIVSFYNEQRDRYREALTDCGLELFSGQGGFYHWGRLPGNLTADEFNERIFQHDAAILPGTLCDMYRRGSEGPLGDFIRFSFGPLQPETLEENIAIIRQCLA